jgi:hypothetical protein
LPIPFFSTISDAIRLSANYLGLHRVTYHPTETIDITSPLANLHPALLKFEKDYGDQNEMRAIWSSKTNHAISPIYINVSTAIQYCSVHKILDSEEIKPAIAGTTDT